MDTFTAQMEGVLMTTGDAMESMTVEIDLMSLTVHEDVTFIKNPQETKFNPLIIPLGMNLILTANGLLKDPSDQGLFFSSQSLKQRQLLTQFKS